MATVKDPVCGMMIDTESAQGHTAFRGRTYYFCSSECVAAFELNPEQYAAEADEALEPEHEDLEKHEPPYTTLGFLTSPKFGAAGSGGLEYERLPEAHDPKRP